VIAKEKIGVIIEIWREVSKVLTAEELEGLLKYIVDQRTYGEIGYVKVENYKAKKSNQKKRIRKHAWIRGYRRISAVMTKLKTLVVSENLILCKEFLLDNPSMTEATTPKIHFGWLVTVLQKINGGGYWTKPQKTDKQKSEYKSRSICLIPSYLSQSFGDTKTKCGICGVRCSRKSNN
jgi:hypothetical protein